MHAKDDHSPHQHALVSPSPSQIKVSLSGQSKDMGWKGVPHFFRVSVVLAISGDHLVGIGINELVRVDGDESGRPERGVNEIQKVSVSET